LSLSSPGYRSEISRAHYGTTRKLTEVKQNVPIDDAKFDMLAAPK